MCLPMKILSKDCLSERSLFLWYDRITSPFRPLAVERDSTRSNYMTSSLIHCLHKAIAASHHIETVGEEEKVLVSILILLNDPFLSWSIELLRSVILLQPYNRWSLLFAASINCEKEAKDRFSRCTR